MDGKTRAGLTVFIWLALLTAVTTIITVAQDLDNGVVFMLVGASFTLLLFSTAFLWNWGRLPFTGAVDTSTDTSTMAKDKEKRPDRVNAVLNALTDDELDALRQRLSHREDTVSLAKLLDDEGELRR